MTKRQALMKLRTDWQFRICSYDDYMRLMRHIKCEAEYTQVQVDGYKGGITALKHNGLLFIPCLDNDVTNCWYDPERAK